MVEKAGDVELTNQGDRSYRTCCRKGEGSHDQEERENYKKTREGRDDDISGLGDRPCVLSS